jgi:excisionase family DNA binding protein
MAREPDDAQKRIRQAFEEHRRALDTLEEAILEGFEQQRPQEDGQQLLTIPEVCQRLGVGRSWVYQQVKSGDMPSVKLRGAVKVKREDLEEYINANRHG